MFLAALILKSLYVAKERTWTLKASSPQEMMPGGAISRLQDKSTTFDSFLELEVANIWNGLGEKQIRLPVLPP